MSEPEFRPLTQAERATIRKRTAHAFSLVWHFSGFPVEVRQPCERCGCLLWARVPGSRWPGVEGARCLHCMPPLEMLNGHPEMMKIVEESLRDV